MSKLEPLQRPTIRDQVAKAIRDAILAGELRAGERVTELSLAKQLQVSQATVREALMRLEHTGLVVRNPNKETRVNNLSRREVVERIAIRKRLEPMAAIAAADRITAADYDRLDRLQRQMSEALSSRDYLELSERDLEFHRHIWKCSGNETLCKMLDALVAPLFAFVNIMTVAHWTTPETIAPPHQPIITALETQNPVEIETAIQAHIDTSFTQQFLASGAEDVRAVLDEHGRSAD